MEPPARLQIKAAGTDLKGSNGERRVDRGRQLFGLNPLAEHFAGNTVKCLLKLWRSHMKGLILADMAFVAVTAFMPAASRMIRKSPVPF